jgi:inner membrane protease subunit 2
MENDTPSRFNLHHETNHALCANRSPANSDHVAVKRVVGLPGDRITTRKPCLRTTQIVPYNHVWLEGDAEDPDRTMDSNTYGPVSISLISGRVVAVLSPRMRWLDWRQWESGNVDDVEKDSPLGPNYRQEVRNRVVKEAVKLERPPDF